MWILLTVLLVILLIIMWLLWARIIVCLNSYEHKYYLSYGGIVRVEPKERESDIVIQVKLPYYKFIIDPMSPSSKTKKPAQKTKPKADKSEKMKISFYLKCFIQALKTFSMRRFAVNMDTGDYTLNARLVPVLVALNRKGAQLSVNYLGKFDYWIEIENRLVRFIPIALRFLKEKYL